MYVYSRTCTCSSTATVGSAVVAFPELKPNVWDIFTAGGGFFCTLNFYSTVLTTKTTHFQSQPAPRRAPFEIFLEFKEGFVITNTSVTGSFLHWIF